MTMLSYIFKRITLMVFTLFIIMTITFTLIKLLQPEVPPMTGLQAMAELQRREALGYNKPIMVQYGIYLRNIFTKGDFGTSWKIDYLDRAEVTLFRRLPPTMLVNTYSILFAIPLGILLGIWAAIKKNKITDHVISTSVMVFVSVPSFVYAFILQYTLGFKLNWFPVIISSLYEAGGSWMSGKMTKSLILPVLALSFAVIAGLARFTRAELTEALTSDYMLLARAKGLTKSKAIMRHAMRNAMVPILPSILSEFVGVLFGAMIIESIFSINGSGRLLIRAMLQLDYDVFVTVSMFYALIGLASMILIDLSYGFLDPRVRMGER